MKLISYLASFALLTFMLPVSAFARATNSGSFDLADAARIGSTQLTPGHYKAEWTGTANKIEVSILRNGKTVATIPGQLKNLPERAATDSVTLKTVHNAQRIEEIDFHNRAEALEFAD